MRIRLVISITIGALVAGCTTIGAFTGGLTGAATGFLLGTVGASALMYSIIVREAGGLSFEILRIGRILVALGALAILSFATEPFIGSAVTLLIAIGTSGTLYFLVVSRIGIITVDEKFRLLDAAPSGTIERTLDRLIA